MNKEDIGLNLGISTEAGEVNYEQIDSLLIECLLNKDKDEYSTEEVNLIATYYTLVEQGDSETKTYFQEAVESGEEVANILEELQKEAETNDAKTKKKKVTLFKLVRQINDEFEVKLKMTQIGKILELVGLEEKEKYEEKEGEAFLEKCREVLQNPPENLPGESPTVNGTGEDLNRHLQQIAEVQAEGYQETLIASSAQRMQQINSTIDRMAMQKLASWVESGQMTKALDQEREKYLQRGVIDTIAVEIDGWDKELNQTNSKQITGKSETQENP